MSKKSVLLILVISGLFCIELSLSIPKVRASWVEEPITVDTTWGIDGSPYVVIDNIVVYPNATLTISAGVTVKFGDGFALTVNGNMTAYGTSNQPIMFTSNRISSNPPFPGVWGGISYEGDVNTRFVLSHSQVSFAATGFWLKGSGIADIENCSVTNSTYGLDSDRGALTDHNTKVAFSNFSNCQMGVRIKATSTTDFTFYGNDVSWNEQVGMSYDTGVPITNVAIQENRFYGNGHDGLLVNYNYYTMTANNFTIARNTISYNGKAGFWGGGLRIRLSNISIICNNIAGNHEHGIIVYDVFDSGISSNTIISNDGAGVYVSWGSSPLISNNTVAYNAVGIEFNQAAQAQVHYNDIYSNSEYGAYIDLASSAQDVTSNFWGDSSGPYHLSINPSGLGNKVNGNGQNLKFIPFLSSATVLEFPLFLILPLFMIATFLVITLYRRKRVGIH